jgi:hypothetical protein
MSTAASATVLRVPPDTPHHAVQTMLRSAVYDPAGAVCPTCTQHAQVYRWSLYSTAVQALILFQRLGGTTDFTHSNELKDYGYKGQGDAARLRMWGLVERQSDQREDGGRSGYWRVTSLGERFVLGQVRVPKYAWVYNGRVLRMDGEPVGVREALGNRFNYDDMMGIYG